MNSNQTENKNNNEVDKFSKELTKKIDQINNKGPSRLVSLRFNPFIILIIVVIAAFLLIGLLNNRDYYIDKITLDQLVKGLNGNKYSQVFIQNDGKIIANGKTFVITKDSVSSDNLKDQPDVKLISTTTDNFETKTLDDLVKSLAPVDFITQLKALLNKQGGGVKEIIVGDNYIIGVRSLNEKHWLIKNVTEKDLLSKFEDKNININSLSVPLIKLRTQSINLDNNSFEDRLNSKQFSDIWQIDGTTIAQIRPQFVSRVYIDWTPNIYSFTDLLQKEGISLTADNYELVSLNIPSGITFDDILTVLTLVGFVVLGFIIFRGAQSSGMGIMQFGQSKAKIFFGSKTDTTFKDVAGIDEARDELNEIVDFLKNPNKYRKLGARIPKGILMVGPPGTGKTLLARAIAGEAGVPFFHTSGSEFEEMLVGAGASRVRDLFSKAKKAAPALIFIDEIDAVARKRGTRVQSGTTEQTLNQILVEMDGFEKNVNLIVLAATNRPDVLDPAILRPGRFDRQVRIEYPDMEGRKEILAIHGKNKPFALDVNLEKIAKRTVGFTGADLENILNEAAIIAAKEGKKEINMDDIEESVSKVVLGPAKKSRKRTDKELQLVAYHEAGHAVVSRYTPNATPVDKISITSRGSSGGVTMFLPEKDEYITSRGKLIADITVSLGGRAAEEVALDDISTGASNDIEKATQVAKRMIQKFGMSEKLGLVQYGEMDDSEYLGYAYGESRTYSEKTAEGIDEEVRDLIKVAYIQAKKILVENRDKLDRVAKMLLDKEVLGKEEFEALFT